VNQPGARQCDPRASHDVARSQDLDTILQRYATVDVALDIQGQAVHITKIADFEALLTDISPVTFAEDERLPYWAELWPSAIAMASYIVQHLSLPGRPVLELGCGLGLAGVVAARHGAHVLCTDYEAAALTFARHNARRNACQHIHFRLVDWRQPALRRRYAYILASDVIYEARNFGPLVALLKRYLARDGVAVFSEPGRVNAVPFFALLRQRGFTYDRDVQPVEWDGMHRIAIYTIRHRKREVES
jgi:predicted nicotinamide N-methyase